MKTNIKANHSRIKKTAKSVLLVGMLLLFFFYVPIEDIYTAVRNVDAKLFWSSFLVGFPALYLGAMQLWFLARKQGINLFIYQVYIINLSVKFYSFFSPVSIVGSGLKWYKLSTRGKEAEALSAIAFSRVWDIFIAVFFGMVWMMLGLNPNIIHPVFLALFLFFLLGGWFSFMKFSPTFGEWAKSKSVSLTRKSISSLFASIGKLLDAISTYKNLSLKDFLFLIMASFSKEIISLMGHVLLARALSIHISFIDLGWMRSIFFLSALAPFTMVGGVGLREVSIVLVMSAFGISAELALAYSFLLYARSVLLHLSGGVVELLSTFFEKGRL